MWLLTEGCNETKATHQSGPRFAAARMVRRAGIGKEPFIRETELESDQLG